MIVKLFVVVSLAVCTAIPAAADDRVYDNELQAWRESREKSLRADNGWLTLAGRFPLKSRDNTFGTGKDNDVVFPPELKGVGPDRLGTLHIDADAGKVTLRLAQGVTMLSGDKPFTKERVLGTDQPDWVVTCPLNRVQLLRDKLRQFGPLRGRARCLGSDSERSRSSPSYGRPRWTWPRV